jgi:hypothetical protein
MVRNLADNTLIKLYVLIQAVIKYIKALRKTHTFSIWYFSSTQSNLEKTSDNSKLRDILQNALPELFRSTKLMKDKERLDDMCPRQIGECLHEM